MRMVVIILCREAEYAEEIAGQSNRPKDDHEDPNDPEPERRKVIFRQNISVQSLKYTAPIKNQY